MILSSKRSVKCEIQTFFLWFRIATEHAFFYSLQSWGIYVHFELNDRFMLYSSKQCYNFSSFFRFTAVQPRGGRKKTDRGAPIVKHNDCQHKLPKWHIFVPNPLPSCHYALPLSATQQRNYFDNISVVLFKRFFCVCSLYDFFSLFIAIPIKKAKVNAHIQEIHQTVW